MFSENVISKPSVKKEAICLQMKAFVQDKTIQAKAVVITALITADSQSEYSWLSGNKGNE